MLPFDGNPSGISPDAYLTLTDASGAANAFRLDKVGDSQPDRDVQYSVDGGRTWTQYGWTGNTGDSVAVRPYGSVKWRGVNSDFSVSDAAFLHFASDGLYDVSGNILSLIDGKGETRNSPASNYLFVYLFWKAGVRDASRLLMPVSFGGTYSCWGMFYGCTTLTAAPELPAATLAAHCYRSMFSGCTSLVSVQAVLPAATAVTRCYNAMFSGCASLASAPAIRAAVLGPDCCLNMFNGCTSLVSPPALPATTLGTQCYHSMFDGCTSLVNAPELPATTLNTQCYQGMFNRCSSLTTAPELPATSLASYCYYGMFAYCTSLSAAPSVLPALSVPNQAYRSMFSHCTSLVAGPEIMATSFSNAGNGALYSMFNDCPNLSSLTVHFTSWDGSGGSAFSAYWLTGVAETGTFTCPEGLDTTTRSASTVPEGWNVVNF